jgi:hypothetical protein
MLQDDFEYVKDPVAKKRMLAYQEKENLKRKLDLERIKNGLALNEMVMAAVHRLGGTDWFVDLAIDDPKTFAQLLSTLVKAQGQMEMMNKAVKANSGFNFQMILNNDSGMKDVN